MLLSRPLKVATPYFSTSREIPLPKGKFCPTRLRPWEDCFVQQQAIYNSVRNYLQSTGNSQTRLFTPLIALEELARHFALQSISSERGLESYEQIAVEDHVRDIIAELCKIPAAREEFRLGDGVRFDNYTSVLTENQVEVDSSCRPRPDRFCIHRIDDSAYTLLLTVEYKPSRKLSVENLRAGLRPIDLWEELVQTNHISTDPAKKLQYNAELLTNSAVVQAYDVMVEEGRPYCILTNGLARVLLHMPYDDPTTLYYHLCESNVEIGEDEQDFQQPRTSVARELCLCLMSFRSRTYDQEWRNFWRSKLHIWETSFDYSRSLIPKAELRQTPPHSRSYVPPDSSSDYQPSLSSPLESPTAVSCRVHTRNDQGSQSRSRHAQFCTQRCLLGLHTKDVLDDSCPNVEFHRQAQDSSRHPINAEVLVRLLKAQLDENIDRCIPFGSCGAYGAPFKLTCATYGYTVVGKGTTSRLWEEVSREAQVYQILRKAQGSAVPVFLGTIDLAKIYFLHGGGHIRHMLVMGWGGEETVKMELEPWLRQEIRRSDKEIQALGIIHDDLRRENVLWNKELGRALIIDFHRYTLKKHRPVSQPSRTAKRQICQAESRDVKCLRTS